MKRKINAPLLLLICILLLTPEIVRSNSPLKQSEEADFDKFGIGFGIGIGFFSCEDVNQWLEDRYSIASMTFGSTDIFMNEGLSFVVTIRPVKLFRINIAAEAVIGPKLISLNGSSELHNFGRFSFGADALLNIPISSGQNSIVMGVGSYYHSMYFEDYSAGTLGLRVIPFGMSFQFGGFQPQFQLGADLFSKAVDETNQPPYSSAADDGFELSYNGGFIKILILF